MFDNFIPTSMKLEFNDQQKMIQNMVKEFAEKEVAPIAAELDEKSEYPTKTLKKMSKLGLLGIIVPTEYGGAGLDTISYAIVVEEISRKCASTGVITSVHNSLVAWPIMKYGTEEQKKKWLTPIASGEKVGAFGLTEPDAGSDAGSIRTTAVLHGNEWVINGTKQFATNIGLDNASIIVITAVTKKAAKGRSYNYLHRA